MNSLVQRSEYWRNSAAGALFGVVIARAVMGLTERGSTAQLVGFGVIGFIIFSCYAYGWWLGRKAIEEKYEAKVG